MIENNVQKLLTQNEGYIKKSFGIIPNKEVEILIPKNLDFLKSEPKFNPFCNSLNNEIEILSKLSIFQNKQHPCKYDDELKTINESNFYETILRMYTMEGFLYKEVNKILRNSHSNDFHQICYYYTALLASVAFYSKSTSPLMKEENIIKEGEKSLILYRGGGISENEILAYKNSGNSCIIRQIFEFLSTSYDESKAMLFMKTSKSKFKALYVIEIPLEEHENSIVYLGNISKFKDEKECLIKSGSLLKVEDIIAEEENIFQVKLKLVSF